MRGNAARDPYDEFLARNRGLANAADAILAGIAEFGSLNSKDEFVIAAKRLADEDRSQDKPVGIEAMRRQFRSSKLDRLTQRRYSLVCRAAEVATRHAPWHHQGVCAILLNSGKIVQMPNGSGKTLAAALAAAVGCLQGNRVHIATSNDYLAERDLRLMGGIYHLLDLSAGLLFTAQSMHFAHAVLEENDVLRVAPKEGSNRRTWVEAGSANMIESEAPLTEESIEEDRKQQTNDHSSANPREQLLHQVTGGYTVDEALSFKAVFERDIVYGRIDAFGMAYLEDNLKYSEDEQILRRRDNLIVDECDAVLLDDLRTPLQITRADYRQHLSEFDLRYFHELAKLLTQDLDFLSDGKSVQLTYAGVTALERLTNRDLFTEAEAGYAPALVNALRALHAYKRDEDYVLEDDQVILIQRESGRLLYGRRYTDGLHEALEIKEDLVASDVAGRAPLARVTIKNFVRTYKTVSGMSGAVGAQEEYRQFYGLECVDIPPYQGTRKDHPDLVYGSRREAIEYGVADAATKAAKRGQPVLINVPALRDVELVAARLTEQELKVQALDAHSAGNLGEEAEKVSRAGEPGLVTICSKVAARGTDILLSTEAKEAGGLFVIGLERELDRRYDDQLRGRAGRHGDPGDSLFVSSFDGELFAMFGFGRRGMQSLMRKLGMEEGVPTEGNFISSRIKASQRNVQRRNHATRLQVVELDDITERHRIVFYNLRQKVLAREDCEPDVLAMIENWVHIKNRTSLKRGAHPGLQDGEHRQLFGQLQEFMDEVELNRVLQVRNRRGQLSLLKETVTSKVTEALRTLDPSMVKSLILYSLDRHWAHYLSFQDAALEEMGLYSGENPLGLARFSETMEEKFDSFFYEVGETALVEILQLSRSGHLFTESALAGGDG